MLNKVIKTYNNTGIKGIYSAAKKFIARRINLNRAKCYPVVENIVSKGAGLEIGGPSGVFMKDGILPIYPIIQKLDNCNFSNNTIWEGSLKEGQAFIYDSQQKPGRQFIFDASENLQLKPSTYNFLLSSHVIEHIANPIKALSAWKTALKENGMLVLLVPHKKATFDHRRPLTTLKHLIEDFDNNTKEDDLTHLEEILALHDLEKDKRAGDFINFKSRSENNYENRCLHHHVFDAELVVQLLSYMNLQILAIECFLPHHIIAIAQKVSCAPDNEPFIGNSAKHLKTSPF